MIAIAFSNGLPLIEGEIFAIPEIYGYPLVGGKPRNPKWDELARSVIKEVKACECCGTKNRLQAHHKKPYYMFPELEMERDNIKVGCAWCHFVVYHANNYLNYVEHVDALASRHLRLVRRLQEGRQ